MTAYRRGFTIIELMIVVVIVAILATFAAPNLSEMVGRMRLKTASGELHTSLLFARSEAIKRNAVVTIVPTNAADWSQGWQVQDAGAVVMQRQDAFPGVTFSTRNAAYAAQAVATIAFNGSGRESANGAGGVAFVLTLPAYGNVLARCVVLDPSGRPAVRNDKNGDAADGCN